MSYKSLIRRSTRRHQVNFLSDSDSDTEDKYPRSTAAKRTPLSAPALQTESVHSPSGSIDRQAPQSNPQMQEAKAMPILAVLAHKPGHQSSQNFNFQVFDSPQQPQLSGPKSPQWAKPDRHSSPNSPHIVNPDNKENAFPEPNSASRKSPGSPMPVDARTLLRVEQLEQRFLQHQQQVHTQLDGMQEQLTALSQKHLDNADFPEQVVHHIEQDLAEVISRLDRQVDTLTQRVDNLPSEEDWALMEEAMAAILDEAATRQEQEEQAADAAAVAAQDHSHDASSAAEAGQASCAESRVKQEDHTLEEGPVTPVEEQSACDMLAVAMKEEADGQLSGAVVEREQLDDALRQQQADTRSQLDLMNEKMESWVCQCFSDLKNRIVELETLSGSAKAQVLQASIGVSCNEDEIRNAAQTSAQQPDNKGSQRLQINPAAEGSAQSRAANWQSDLHQDDSTSVFSAPRTMDDLWRGIPIPEQVQGLQRHIQVPLTLRQLAGVALGLLAAIFWYGVIALWDRHSDFVHSTH